MGIDLFDAVQDIVEWLNAQTDPENGKVNVWSKIVAQISERDSLDASYCEIVEKGISDYLNKLDDDAKRQLWTETESGLGSDAEAQDFLIDSIEMELEMELLDEVTQYAWHEAGR